MTGRYILYFSIVLALLISCQSDDTLILSSDEDSFILQVHIKIDIQDHVSNSGESWYSWHIPIENCNPSIHASYDIEARKVIIQYCTNAAIGSLVESSVVLSNDYCAASSPNSFDRSLNNGLVIYELSVDSSFHQCLIYDYDWINMYCEFD